MFNKEKARKELLWFMKKYKFTKKDTMAYFRVKKPNTFYKYCTGRSMLTDHFIIILKGYKWIARIFGREGFIYILEKFKIIENKEKI